jgi:rubrerythrin
MQIYFIPPDGSEPQIFTSIKQFGKDQGFGEREPTVYELENKGLKMVGSEQAIVIYPVDMSTTIPTHIIKSHEVDAGELVTEGLLSGVEFEHYHPVESGTQLTPVTKDVDAELDKSIDEEYGAAKIYRERAAVAPKQVAEIYRHIAGDEDEHAKIFKQTDRAIEGKDSFPTIVSEACSNAAVDLIREITLGRINIDVGEKVSGDFMRALDAVARKCQMDWK